MVIHSIIDQITNSSTTTYIFASDGAIRNVYGAIQAVLDACGSHSKAEDLFDISTEDDEGWALDIISDAIGESDDSDFLAILNDVNNNEFDIDNISYEDANKLAEKVYQSNHRDHVLSLLEDNDSLYRSRWYHSVIVVKDKQGNSTDIGQLIMNSVGAEGSYDG